MSDPWNTTYALRGEQKIRRNNLLASIPLLKKVWKVSFDFKANKFSGFQQLLHMTIGGKGVGSGAKYGDRTPAIWTHPSRGFLVSSAVGGKPSFAKNFKALPSTGEWINIEVGQQLKGSETIFYVSIGGDNVFSTRNTQPSEFENVKVFASSRWYRPVSGFIKNLLIQNKNDGRSILALKFIFLVFLGARQFSVFIFWCSNQCFNIAANDAKWEEWAGWSPCSTSCGHGSKVRARACHSEPAFGGDPRCPGNGTEMEDCETSECPGNTVCVFLMLC